MRCYECGGTYVRKRGSLQITDKYVGAFTVETVEYMTCDKCGGDLFSPEVAQRIEDAREKALQDILRSQPLKAFILAAEAADALGISRQALHKHRRIRRGFIFRTLFGEKTAYLRESVELFRKQGDGRFPLLQSQTTFEYGTQRKTAPLPSYPGYEARSESPRKVFSGTSNETGGARRPQYVR